MTRSHLVLLLSCLSARALPAQEPAQEPPTLEELERRIDLLSQELEQQKIGAAAAPQADQAQLGFGPAASKIYRAAEGVSIGGYGEMVYSHFDSRTDAGEPSGRSDTLDLLRVVLYFGYKFDEHWLFNSEIEFEHANTDEGEVAVEFAYLDYLWREPLNARAGLVLIPMGFLNEMHEPTTFLSANRPGIERVILPSTWRENGAGVFGQLGDFGYRAYVVAGLDAEGFTAAGLRDGRQGGSRSQIEDVAAVGRVDWTGVNGLLLGASAYTGGSGQDLMTAAGGDIGARTSILEGHLQWNWRGLQFRALGTTARVDDAAQLNQALGLTGNDSIGEEMTGYYLELGYDVLSLTEGSSMSLTPFVRFEAYDTQKEVPSGYSADGANDVNIVTYGLAWQPFPQGILKADYQNIENLTGSAVNQFNVALGYIF